MSVALPEQELTIAPHSEDFVVASSGTKVAASNASF
jgi:hypothetical protein